MTTTEQDKLSDEELKKEVLTQICLIKYGNAPSNLSSEQLAQVAFAASDMYQLITADRKRVALEARIDTATDILYGFSRTYKQKVTDSAGNVYADESHGYISKYEVQELVAELKAQQEEV